MTPGTRWVLLAALLAAFTIAVVVAGQRAEPPPVAGVERLGPESGEPVADYLRRAGGSLPPAGGDEVWAGEMWALVQLSGYLDPAAAAALVPGGVENSGVENSGVENSGVENSGVENSGVENSGVENSVRLSGVVLRVPLPGVQTALVFRDLPGQRPAAELASAVRAAGQDRARAAAQAPPGSRHSAVAAAEAARLRAGCACVLALLVRADGDVLRALADRPGVRAVHAASPGTSRQGLAVAPLLPEQHDVAGPVPDDRPVPR
ncbi:MAG: hypothetical protein ACRDSL_01845 [Pseudonocardiaceae bacterium]